MLHPIQLPPEAVCLDRIVELQKALIRALCQPGMTARRVTPRWLHGLWPNMPPEWSRRFLENDKGARQEAMKQIAGATAAQKAVALRVCESQWRFAELYTAPVAHRIEPLDHVPAVLADALHELLTDFYAPWLNAADGRGYPAPVGGADELFRRPEYVTCWHGANATKVCVYCDDGIRHPQCDHFLPQSQFPALSCAPRNLIPVCPECNEARVKGAKVPLALAEAEQAGAWFHPYERPATGRFTVQFQRGGADGWALALRAVVASDTQRVSNLDWLLDLSSFWRERALEYLRGAGTACRHKQNADGTRFTREELRAYLRGRAEDAEKETARFGMRFLDARLYRYCAEDAAQFEEIWAEYRA